MDLEFKAVLKSKFPHMFAKREKIVTQMGLVGDSKTKITLEIGNRFDLCNNGARGTRGLVSHRQYTAFVRIRNEEWKHMLGNLISHCTFEIDSHYFTTEHVKRVDVAPGELECRYTNVCMPEHDKYFEMPINVHFREGTGFEALPLKVLHEMNIIGKGRWDSYSISLKTPVFEQLL